MQYQISGADGETGEDIVMTIEAKSSEEARAKAARKGILVEGCRRAGSQGGVAVASPTKLQAASQPIQSSAPPVKKKSFLARVGVFAAVLVVAICAAGGWWYKFVGLPEQERIQKTHAETIAQIDKTTAMREEAESKALDKSERRRMALNVARGGSDDDFANWVSNDLKWTLTQAIRNDPFVPDLIASHPIVGEKIRDPLADLQSVLDRDECDDISIVDKGYLVVFHRATASLRR